MRNSCLIWLYFLISLNVMNISSGAIISELYNAEIEVATKHINDVDRSNFIKIELDKILRKITGKKTSLSLEEAEQYLSKYEYLENYPSENKLTLKLYFDKNLINKTLHTHRYVTLSENRMHTLIWVKVDDAVLFENVQQFLNKISSIGIDYGLTIIYPVLDLLEVQLLNQNIEYNQFIQNIKEFSKKYAAEEIIVAYCHMHEQGFIMNWQSITNSWAFKNQLIHIHELNNINSNDTDSKQEKNDGFNEQANAFVENLFQHFISLEIQNTTKIVKQTISLKINNIKNLENYVKVEKYLQELPVISNLNATKFQGEEVEFQMIVTGGKTAIKKALANNKMFYYEKNKIGKNNYNVNLKDNNIINDVQINSNILNELSSETDSLLYTFQDFS